MTRGVSILGSTGSVGKATLDVVQTQGDTHYIDTLTAQTNVALLAEQAKATNARRAVIGDEALYADLKAALSGTKTEIAAGRAALIAAAKDAPDYTMAAIVGMAGLEPLLAAISAGKKVAIANKEPLVAAGSLVMNEAEKSGATLLPVDSEHNAVFQVFDAAQKQFIQKIILTASGGPFREWPESRLAGATPAQAINHPNWSMGKKISIDSATMMNKALEVIEAHHFFGLPPEKIEVVIHPQSIIHSMVEYADGSVLAQMGASDMRVPITHSLGWPSRLNGPAQHLDFTKISSLTFEAVDDRRFPAIKFAYDCIMQGHSACIALNAANEVAVEAFLGGTILFTDIFDIVRTTVHRDTGMEGEGLEAVLAHDEKMRTLAKACILEGRSSFDSPPQRKTQ